MFASIATEFLFLLFFTFTSLFFGNACFDLFSSNRSLEIDLELEGEGSVDKKVFLEELRKGGLRGALAWRDRRFGG